MASIAQTAFEPKVTNLQRNNTQNIAGKFIDGNQDPDICPSGFLCARYGSDGPLPNEGYTGIPNTNAWPMYAAPDGTYGSGGDHTGIYAFNSYDVPQATNNMGNVYNIGGTTLGLELPAGQMGTFTEIIIGEIYKFGKGNFSTAPTSSDTVAHIDDGLLVADIGITGGEGVYFELLAEEGFTLGARYGFDGYLVRACRAPASLGSLDGVVLTSPSNTEVLKFNGTNWVNAADAT